MPPTKAKSTIGDDGDGGTKQSTNTTARPLRLAKPPAPPAPPASPAPPTPSTPSQPITAQPMPTVASSRLPERDLNSKPQIDQLEVHGAHNVVHIKSSRPGARAQYFAPSHTQITTSQSLIDIVGLLSSSQNQPLRFNTQAQWAIKQTLKAVKKDTRNGFNYQYGVYVNQSSPSRSPSSTSNLSSLKAGLKSISAEDRVHLGRLMYRIKNQRFVQELQPQQTQQTLGNPSSRKQLKKRGTASTMNDGDGDGDDNNNNTRMNDDNNNNNDIDSIPAPTEPILTAEQLISLSLPRSDLDRAEKIIDSFAPMVLNDDDLNELNHFSAVEVAGLNPYLLRTYGEDMITKMFPPVEMFAYATLMNLAFSATNHLNTKTVFENAPTAADAMADIPTASVQRRDLHSEWDAFTEQDFDDLKAMGIDAHAEFIADGLLDPITNKLLVDDYEEPNAALWMNLDSDLSRMLVETAPGTINAALLPTPAARAAATTTTPSLATTATTLTTAPSTTATQATEATTTTATATSPHTPTKTSNRKVQSTPTSSLQQLISPKPKPGVELHLIAGQSPIHSATPTTTTAKGRPGSAAERCDLGKVSIPEALSRSAAFKKMYPLGILHSRPYDDTTQNHISKLIRWSNSRHYFNDTLTKLEHGLGRPLDDDELHKLTHTFCAEDSTSLPEYQTLENISLIPDLRQLIISDYDLVKTEAHSLQQLGIRAFFQTSSVDSSMSEAWFPSELSTVAILYGYITSQLEADISIKQSTFLIQFSEFMLYLFDSLFETHLLYPEEITHCVNYKAYWYRMLYDRFIAIGVPLEFKPHDWLSPSTKQFIAFLEEDQGQRFSLKSKSKNGTKHSKKSKRNTRTTKTTTTKTTTPKTAMVTPTTPTTTTSTTTTTTTTAMDDGNANQDVIWSDSVADFIPTTATTRTTTCLSSSLSLPPKRLKENYLSPASTMTDDHNNEGGADDLVQLSAAKNPTSPYTQNDLDLITKYRFVRPQDPVPYRLDGQPDLVSLGPENKLVPLLTGEIALRGENNGTLPSTAFPQFSTADGKEVMVPLNDLISTNHPSSYPPMENIYHNRLNASNRLQAKRLNDGLALLKVRTDYSPRNKLTPDVVRKVRQKVLAYKRSLKNVAVSSSASGTISEGRMAAKSTQVTPAWRQHSTQIPQLVQPIGVPHAMNPLDDPNLPREALDDPFVWEMYQYLPDLGNVDKLIEFGQSIDVKFKNLLLGLDERGRKNRNVQPDGVDIVAPTQSMNNIVMGTKDDDSGDQGGPIEPDMTINNLPYHKEIILSELELNSVSFRPSEHYGFTYLLRLCYIIPHLNLATIMPKEWSQYFAYTLCDLNQWLLQQTNLQVSSRKSREAQLFKVRSLLLNEQLKFSRFGQDLAADVGSSHETLDEIDIEPPQPSATSSSTTSTPASTATTEQGRKRFQNPLPFDDENKLYYETGNGTIMLLTPEYIQKNYNEAVTLHHHHMNSKLAAIRAYTDELRMAKQLGIAFKAQSDLSQMFGLLTTTDNSSLVAPQSMSHQQVDNNGQRACQNTPITHSHGAIFSNNTFTDLHYSGSTTERVLGLAGQTNSNDLRNRALASSQEMEFFEGTDQHLYFPHQLKDEKETEIKP